MKILQLRFKNLNSLVGEWKIDFTAPEYVSEGIFAISGPTGAGKSTILDAICLALYGRTPRLINISSSTNEIMSRKTGECFAEVIFQSQKGTFTTCWSQTKARRSATGNLQQAKHEISNYDTGAVISSQIKTTLKAVEDYTGMDFNRFTQAMMLAQGGFAAFLKASADERAPILEQITGTAIYTEISRRVFERNRSENVQLELIKAETNGIVILREDEIAALKTEFAEKETHEKEQSLLKQTLDISIKWLNDIELLKKELTSIQQEEITHQNALAVFAPEREVLEKANKAYELEVDYTILASERTVQERDTTQLAAAEIALPKRKAELEAAIIDMNAAAKRLEKVVAETSIEKEIITKVREIDVNIVNQKTLHKNATDEVDAKLKAKKELEATIKTLTESVVIKQQEQENANQYLEKNKTDALLVTELGAISASLNHLLQAKTLFVNQKTQLIGFAKQVDLEKEKELTEKKKLDIQKSTLKAMTDKVLEAQESMLFLLNNRTLADYRNEQDLLNQKLLLMREIESLETKRRQLEDDVACPLCGSLHHPFAEGNIPDANDTELKLNAVIELIKQVEKLNASLATAEKEEQTIKNQLIIAESTLQIIENNIAKFTTDLALEKSKVQQAESDFNTLKAKVLHALAPLGITELADEAIQKTDENMKFRHALWNKNADVKTKIDEIIHNLKANIETQTALQAAAEKQLENVNENKTKVEADLQLVIAERMNLFGNKNTKEEESRLEYLLKSTSDAERKTVETMTNAKNQHNNIIAQIDALTKAILARKAPLQALELAFQQLLLKADFITEATFIACKIPKSEKDNLANKSQLLDNKKLEIASKLHDRKVRLENEEVKLLTEEAIELLMEKAAEIGKVIDAAKDRKVTISEQLRVNNEGLMKIEQVLVQLNVQKSIAAKWGNLSSLIGSADGKKFRNFAQGLTFEIMVSHANKQLTKLTDRYLLVRDREEPLNLNVIDNYQAGECRSTKNLSGGESFYISLALALGLSSMSSKNVRVDSLFLDEGFGTLDEETLEIALETLASLRQDGKLIGVISHVSSLKDRINTKIEVQKRNSGNSVIVGCGCERLG